MRRKCLPLLLCIALLLVALGAALPASAAGPRYFPETGMSVQGAFLNFFDRYGGLGIFGYPITNEILENNTTVQYFQRARLEWRPWNADPYKVEVGLLGTLVHGSADPAVANWTAPGRSDQRYFSQTGHAVTGAFLAFYNRYGSLTVFGYPITEAYQVENGIIVQYFQRARMEYYPGNPNVQLGNLGSEWYTHQPKWVGTTPAPAPSPSVRVRNFPQTGFNVQGAFLDFWEQRGQLDTFGYPISGEFSVNGRTVQYFQRARMEWFPENAPAYRVQLGLLGTEVKGFTDAPVNNWVTPWNNRARYFPQTGHIVTEGFLDFFNAHGGVDIFGYPISEAQTEGGRIVQWFQRAKMEWWPENPAPWRVQLALLGSALYGQGTPIGQAKWTPVEGFGKVWTDNPAVRNGLGNGVEQQHVSWCAEEPLQGGRLFYRQDTGAIYVLKNDGTWRAYADTWESWRDPEKWGYTPPAGLFEPVRGFGKLWREQLGGPGGALGWGLEVERGLNGTLQSFERGQMLGNDRKEIFVLYNTGAWQKYANLF